MNQNVVKDRIKYLKDLKRIVVKIGSSSITSPEGGLDMANMKELTREVKALMDKGLEVILVSSGAMAAGLKYLGEVRSPKDISDISMLQAAAAVGQVELMKAYRDLFAEHGIKSGQILLTHEDTTRREQYLNIKNTIKNLLKLNVVPVINENDSVAVHEIKFGDNDELGAMASIISEAGLLIVLSDIEGLYTEDPRNNNRAKLISFVGSIGPDIERSAGSIGSVYGVGGMESKIKAAKICSFSGISMVIANSRKKNVLAGITMGQDIGTFFKPGTARKVKSIKKWIAFGVRTRGSIMIDHGAEEAIVSKGKSILPVGITEISGRFNQGDTLKVFSADNVLIAKGISNFSSEEIKKIKGMNGKSILAIHGDALCGEVIHRDCLVVFERGD
ncbi:MAG: glutamate 5-kinase [Actinobacteria bacterium]|nr:glutamate 5-kinase [Actinomycetota bacterium]